MNKTFMRFLIKTTALAMLLTSFLLVDFFFSGTLSFKALAALLPLSLLVSITFLQLAVKPARKKPARAAHGPSKPPHLRVVSSKQKSKNYVA